MVTITLNGITKKYDTEKAKKYFTKEYDECDNMYSLQAQKLCYIIAFLKAGKTEINADSYYY